MIPTNRVHTYYIRSQGGAWFINIHIQQAAGERDMADFNAKLRAYLDRWETLKGKEGEPDDMLAQEFSVSKLRQR